MTEEHIGIRPCSFEGRHAPHDYAVGAPLPYASCPGIGIEDVKLFDGDPE